MYTLTHYTPYSRGWEESQGWVPFLCSDSTQSSSLFFKWVKRKVSRLSPFGVQSIRSSVPFRVQSHSGLVPFEVQSHSGFSPFGVESIRGSVHSRLSLSRFSRSKFSRWIHVEVTADFEKLRSLNIIPLIFFLHGWMQQAEIWQGVMERGCFFQLVFLYDHSFRS